MLATVRTVLLGFTALSAVAESGRGQVVLQGHTDDVYFVGFLGDGATLMSGAEDSSIRLWDAKSGQERGIWQQVPKFDAAPSTKILSLSADGRSLARAGKAQGSAEIWDVAKVVRVSTIQAHQRPVDGLSISGDGSVLVTFSQDESKVWDVKSGRQLVGVAAPNLYSFRAAAITADGKLAAVSTSDKAIALLDVPGGKQIARFDGGPGQLHALAFSPNGKLLASGSDGGPESSVKIWDVGQQTLVEGVRGPSQYAKAVAFSADGRSIASGGMSAIVWNLDQKRTDGEFSGFDGPVRSVAFSPDGSLLATGSEDNLVRIWKLSTH
jgi:WD40 repeat protein